MQILFVENHDRFARTVMQLFLAAHSVTLVPSLAAAKEACASGTFDVSLLDYDLDDGKGTELIPFLLNLASRPRIIAVSAHTEGNEALLRAGADSVCRKSDFAQIETLLRAETIMQAPPSQLDGANVLCFVILKANHQQRQSPPAEWLNRLPEKRQGAGPTADTPLFIRHYVDGAPMPPPDALAICRYDNREGAMYLFYCNAHWDVVTDIDIASVEEGLQQAAIQYEGLQREDWQPLT